jgi:hypothetical protein
VSLIKFHQDQNCMRRMKRLSLSAYAHSRQQIESSETSADCNDGSGSDVGASLLILRYHIQSIPFHSISLSLRSILILSTHIHLGLHSGYFPSGFHTNIPYASSSSLFVVHAFTSLSSHVNMDPLLTWALCILT